MKKILIILILAFSYTTVASGASLKEASGRAARYFKNSERILQNKQIVISEVINYHSRKNDQLAKQIETELYFAFGKQFSEVKLVDESESLSGVSGKNTVFIKGTYKQEGSKATLSLKAIKGMMTGEIIYQAMVEFETQFRKRTLVAVLDMESKILNKEQQKIISDLFREALNETKAFDMASSAEIDRMSPDEIQKASSCTRDECATIIGEQLGVDRVIASSLRKLGKNYQIIAAKIIDVNDGSIITTKSVDYDGNLRSLRSILRKLAEALTSDIVQKQIESKQAERSIPLRRSQQSRMVLISAGEFEFGSNNASDEKPIHTIYLDAFYIDKYEVTVEQYRICYNNSRCKKPKTGKYYNWGKQGRDNHPINGVNWNDAKAFCHFVNKRLPTEAEWEKAATWMSGRKYKFPSGKSSVSCQDAVMVNSSTAKDWKTNGGCNRVSTWNVGRKPEEINATYDMAGNVWEWVEDWYDKSFYTKSPRNNPRGPSLGSKRVFRGGGWESSSSSLLGAKRFKGFPSLRRNFLGFRCVSSP